MTQPAYEPPLHEHGNPTKPHCPGCGTAFCKICDAYGDHLSTWPHPRPSTTEPTSPTTTGGTMTQIQMPVRKNSQSEADYASELLQVPVENGTQVVDAEEERWTFQRGAWTFGPTRLDTITLLLEHGPVVTVNGGAG